MTHDVVAVGASWGGLDAVRSVLGGLPPSLDAAVLVAQHRAPRSHPTAPRGVLGAAMRLKVCEPADKDPICSGTAYLAPPDYHLLVDGDVLSLATDGPVLYSRPSIDVLFQTAAESYRERCVGEVLTGGNADGAAGLARIVELGGAAVVQDPRSAERVEMPLAALERVPEARIVAVEQIASLLVELCGVAKVVA